MFAMLIYYITAPKSLSAVHLPHFINRVSAGFPSPAEDYMYKSLDLNELMIKRPSATFFCRVSGESMRDLGIFDGDLLVVDRAVTPYHGAVVLAAVNGELACKILDTRNQLLRSANPHYAPIPVGDSDLVIEGVISFSVRQHNDRYC